MINFQQQINANKTAFNNQSKIRQYLNGKKVYIIQNTSGHNYLVGGTVTVNTGVNMPISGNQVQLVNTNSYINYNDFRVIVNTAEGLKEIIKSCEATIKEAKAEIEQAKKKLSYLEHYEIQDLDEKQYKAYEIVQIFKEDSSDKEKALAIAQLLG